jgi:hypothetical protein
MDLSIRGDSTSVSTTEWGHAVLWMLREIIGTRLISQLRIVLELVPQLDEAWDKAEVVVTGDPNTPRNFRIRIKNTMSRRQQLLALAHELVHVKQYGKKELVPYKDGTVQWKSKLIPQDIDDYASGTKMYFEAPWEKEARRRESTLYKNYIKHLSKEMLTFS